MKNQSKIKLIARIAASQALERGLSATAAEFTTTLAATEAQINEAKAEALRQAMAVLEGNPLKPQAQADEATRSDRAESILLHGITKPTRGLHFTTCIQCDRTFWQPIPDNAEPEYRHNPRSPWLGLCANCDRGTGVSRVRLNTSLPSVKVPEPDATPTDYGRLDGEWGVWYQVAYLSARRVPYEDRADTIHDILVELAHARQRDNKPIPEPRAYRIASLMVALYWRKVNRTQQAVCILNGYATKPNYRQCSFSHKPARCSECAYHAQRPFIPLETEIEDEEGYVTQLKDTIADDHAVDLAAWLDVQTWLLGCPYRLIEIANKRERDKALTHSERQYLYKWRKRAQISLF